MKKALLALFLAVAGPLHAQTYTANAYLTSMEPIAGGGFKRVSVGAAGQDLAGLARTYGMTVGGDVAITDAVSLSGRAGSLAVNIPSSIAALDAVGAIAAVMSTGPGALIVGAGVAGIVAARIYRDGGLHWDQGQGQEQINSYKCGDSFGATPFLACTAYMGKQDALQSVEYPNGNGTIYHRTGLACAGSPVTCTWQVTSQTHYGAASGGGQGPLYTSTENAQVNVSQSTQCPAVVDASNPLYSVPAGSPPGPDGKCRSARYNHIDMTPAQAAAKVMEKPPAGLADQIRQGLKDMWNPTPRDGSGITPKPDQSVKVTPGPSSITGPTSQPGQPGTTTTTGPGGTTTTTTTPQYNYSYSPTTITYNTTTTVTTVNPQGDTTTTTTNPPATTPQDPTDPCTQHPDTIGCSTLGSPTPPELIPNSDIPVGITAIVFQARGGCPAPEPFAIFGTTYGLSYQPLCDVLGTLRLIMLAFSALACAYIFMEGLRP